MDEQQFFSPATGHQSRAAHHVVGPGILEFPATASCSQHAQGISLCLADFRLKVSLSLPLQTHVKRDPGCFMGTQQTKVSTAADTTKPPAICFLPHHSRRQHRGRAHCRDMRSTPGSAGCTRAAAGKLSTAWRLMTALWIAAAPYLWLTSVISLQDPHFDQFPHCQSCFQSGASALRGLLSLPRGPSAGLFEQLLNEMNCT